MRMTTSRPRRVHASSGRAALKTLTAIAMACLLTTVATARSVDLKPGRYEVTVSYEVQHERQNQSQTAAKCIRPPDLGSPERIFNDRVDDVPNLEEACRVKDFKSGSGKISYDAECSNRMVHVEGTVGEAEFAVVRTVMPRTGQAVPLKFMIRGKRTGDCLLMDGGSGSRQLLRNPR